MKAPVTRDDILALFAVAGFGACAMSPEGTFVFWNHTAERILGLSAAQVIGRRCDEVFAAATPHQSGTASASNLPPTGGLDAGGSPRPLTLSMRCASGSHKQIALTPVVVADQPGSDAFTVYLFDDPPQTRPRAPAGSGVLSPTPAPQLEPDPTSRPLSPQGPNPLSRRETQILQLIAAGTDTAQIAADLQISIHTVRNHVRSLRGKLDAKTKLEAVVTAMRHGLV